MNNKPIGVFDSGVGGLSCVPAIKKALPNETIIYYGDNARAPYGSRPIEEIIQFSIEDAEKLIGMGCKALAIACNTITAAALPVLRGMFDCPIIGIIEPASNYAKTAFPGKRIGVVSTKATAESKAYPFTAKAAPEFVPYIEKDGSVPHDVIRAVLDDFVCDLDVLILGCTHYPFIKTDIESIYKGLIVVNPADALAAELKKELIKNNLLAEEKGEDLYLSSLETEVFKKFVEKLR